MPVLGERLYEHRLAGRFCDVELIPNDSTIGIKCHKLVLMASSDYFSCMFSSGMRETSAFSVTLADCCSEVLLILIDFLYKSERPQGVTCDNVLELFSWAIRCDLTELCDYCWEFIRNSLGPDNVFSVLSFALAHHLKKIKKECILLIQRQFALLADAEEWLDLSYETLEDIFSHQMLRVFHEDIVLQILMRWTQRHPNQKDLLSIIHVENLSQASLEKYKDFLQSVNYVPTEPATKSPSFHVHLILQYKHDMSLLVVVCVTNHHVEIYRYPEISICEYERPDNYQVICCTTDLDGIILGVCRNLNIFCYNHSMRQVMFCENLQIHRGTRCTSNQAAILHLASVHDQLWALIREPESVVPRLARYLSNRSVWDTSIELPSDAHRILDSRKAFSYLYVLKRDGVLIQVSFTHSQALVQTSYVGLGANRCFVHCEGLILPTRHILVHGKDSAGDFWTCCYDERKGAWKSDAARLYHDQTQDDEDVFSYKLFTEASGVYLIEEWSSGYLSLYQWASLEVKWNLLKVFREPRTRLVGPVHCNDCDADTE